MARVRPVRGRMGVRSRPRRRSFGVDPEGARAFLEWASRNPRPRGLEGEPRDLSRMPQAARRWLDNQVYKDYGDEGELNEPDADRLEDEAKAQVNVRGDESLLDLERESLETARETEDYVELWNDKLGQVLDSQRDIVASEEAWRKAERDASVGDPAWDGFPSEGEEFSALPSADRAMLTHAASGEPPRLGRAHPERPAAPYEPLPELSPEQAERNKEGVRKARKTLGSSPVGGQQSMEQTFAPAIEQRGQSLGLSTTDQMLLMAALAAVTGGGSAALRAAPLVGRGALASVAGLGALIGGASPAHAKGTTKKWNVPDIGRDADFRVSVVGDGRERGYDPETWWDERQPPAVKKPGYDPETWWDNPKRQPPVKGGRRRPSGPIQRAIDDARADRAAGRGRTRGQR